MVIARDYYYLTYGIIQKDVMTYGPIEVSFDVYDDFPSYKSGKPVNNCVYYRYMIFFMIVISFLTKNHILRGLR